MRALLLLLVCITAAMPALADPPDFPEPMPEDVHRPTSTPTLSWFGEVGIGANYTFMSANPLYHNVYDGEQSDIFESANGLGLLTYAALGLRVSPLLSIVLRSDYDQRSAGRSETVIDTVLTNTGAILGTNPVQKDYDLSITYETVSLMAELNFDDLIVFLGPSIGIPLSSEFSETAQILEATDPNLEAFYFLGSPSQTKRISGSASLKDSLEMRISLKVGLGYSFEVAPKFTVIPRIGYDFGFTDALTDDHLMDMTNGVTTASLPHFIAKDFRLSSIQASIGVRFTP